MILIATEKLEQILVQEGKNCQIRWSECVGSDEEQALIEEGFMGAIIHVAKRNGIENIEDRILDECLEKGETGE